MAFSSVPRKHKYDVFLTYRGVRMGEAFGSHLEAGLRRKGIKLFVDEGTTTGGRETIEELWPAIEGSKVSVVVFSEDYPSSIMCLHELERIVDCRKNRDHYVIPIYYHIDPMDVRNQTRRFLDQFAVYKNRMGLDKAQEWTDTLIEITSLSGWSSSAVRRESVLVDNVVEDVERILNVAPTTKVIVVDESEPLLDRTEPQNASGNGPKRKATWEWTFIIVNFLLELPSAFLDQLSSVHRPMYAFVSMVISFISIFLCISDLVHRGYVERVRWSWRWPMPWFYYQSPSSRRFGRFADMVGLICAVCQCLVTTINYSFVQHHADSPIKMSAWPVIFAFGLLCSKFLEKPQRKCRILKEDAETANV